MTLTLFFLGASSAEAKYKGADRLAKPRMCYEGTKLSYRLRLSIKHGERYFIDEAIRLTADQKEYHQSENPLFSCRKCGPLPPFQKRLTVLPFSYSAFGMRIKKYSEINAVPKLMKSNRITASIPAKSRTAPSLSSASVSLQRSWGNAFILLSSCTALFPESAGLPLPSEATAAEPN